MSAKMEYKAVAYVYVCGGIIDYNSGWWETKQKAQSELQAVLDHNLPAGVYSMSEALLIRRTEL